MLCYAARTELVRELPSQTLERVKTLCDHRLMPDLARSQHADTKTARVCIDDWLEAEREAVLVRVS